MKKQYLVQMIVAGSLAAGLAMASPVWADDTSQLKEQVKALQDRVNQLEAEQANKQQDPPMVAPQPNGYFDPWADPFAQMMMMRQQMQSNMRQAMADTGAFNPRMDMKQEDKQYIVTMDIPGMDKDKINVQTKDRMLIISGERRSENENNNNNQYFRQERSFGSFMQQIPLPEDAKTDQIEAKYKNGVLTVTVGRMTKEEKKTHSGKIAVQ